MKIWRPYTQMLRSNPLKVEKAHGAFIKTPDGRKIFDGISSWWLITHGHGRIEIAEAIAQQAKICEQVVFANFTHEPAEELAELLAEFLPPNLSTLFFSDNGSTAVEVAMKMAFQFQTLNGKHSKNKFLSFEKAYHGDTCGAMSVSAQSPFTNPFGKMTFDVLYARQGTSIYDPLEKWTSHFSEIVNERGHEICAVIIEPLLQGAGGMIVWPLLAINRICQIAKDNDILVIFDEVMTGFGRTGSMFAFEQCNADFDFLCLSKGLTGGFLPMGLTVTTSAIYEAFCDEKNDKTFYHGHSFTGNALSSAAAVANLKIFKQFPLEKVAKSFVEIHKNSLQQFSDIIAVKEIRTCGTVGILELQNGPEYGSDFSYRMQKLALEKNLFIRPLGNVIYLMPPYCALESDIENSWEIIRDLLTSNFIQSLIF
jgi:adenosylmethionine-8-amino-7-oxononanoate aminotransferase